MDKLFPKNVAPADRLVRVVLGLVGLSLVFFGPQTLWGLVGLVPLATAGLGSCPLYTVLGTGTRSSKKLTA